MISYKIEDGVAMSTNGSIRSYEFDYKFSDMQVGQSLFIPMVPAHFKTRPGKKQSMVNVKKQHIRDQAKRYRRNVDAEFFVETRSRRQAAHGEDGVRVWRVIRKAVNDAK